MKAKRPRKEQQQTEQETVSFGVFTRKQSRVWLAKKQKHNIKMKMKSDCQSGLGLRLATRNYGQRESFFYIYPSATD